MSLGAGVWTSCVKLCSAWKPSKMDKCRPSGGHETCPGILPDSTGKKQRKFLKLKDAVKLISGKCTYLENEEIMLMNVEETLSNCTWDVLGRCRWKKILSWKITEYVIDAAPASEQWLKNFCCQRKTLALQKLLNALELQFHPGTWPKSSQHLVFEIVRKSQCLGPTEHVAGFGNLMYRKKWCSFYWWESNFFNAHWQLFPQFCCMWHTFTKPWEAFSKQTVAWGSI